MTHEGIVLWSMAIMIAVDVAVLVGLIVSLVVWGWLQHRKDQQ